MESGEKRRNRSRQAGVNRQTRCKIAGRLQVPPTASALRTTDFGRRVRPTPKGLTHVLRLQRTSRPRRAPVDPRRLRAHAPSPERGGLRDGTRLPPRHAGLRHPGTLLPRVHEAPRADCPGRVPRLGGAGPRDPLRPRPGAGGLLDRRAGSLAGLQRHLARGRVGPPLRQPGGDPRRRRLDGPQHRVEPASRRLRHHPSTEEAPPAGARPVDRDDPGPRDPGDPGIREFLQPGGP